MLINNKPPKTKQMSATAQCWVDTEARMIFINGHGHKSITIVDKINDITVVGNNLVAIDRNMDKYNKFGLQTTVHKKDRYFFGRQYYEQIK